MLFLYVVLAGQSVSSKNCLGWDLTLKINSQKGWNTNILGVKCFKNWLAGGMSIVLPRVMCIANLNKL